LSIVYILALKKKLILVLEDFIWREEFYLDVF